MNIFLTGGTGFIGKRLLADLSDKHHVFALVRQPDRLEPIVAQAHRQNITPIVGDLTKDRLGLDKESYQQIMASDVIIHAGGPMHITLSQEEAVRSFLHPAKSLVRIVRDIQTTRELKHFIHVVGFMSPYHEQNAMEDLDAMLDHAPPYERMKFQADSYIRKALRKMDIPLSTVNPSVVIGDSASGMTEQTGGLGILVDAVRRNLMPLVPGGRDYWLPMTHVDHVADFISELADTVNVSSNTYYLLDPKEQSSSIHTLIKQIAAEMRVSPPVGSLPLSVLKTLLGTSMGQRFGIPQESMNFLVRSTFPAAPSHNSVMAETLPYVISDLDYRLSHPAQHTPKGFIQRRRSSLITLENDGEGMPHIFLHGTFSGADCLLPLAAELDGIRTMFVDLPGFGRTPYHHQPSILQGYVDAVADMILDLKQPVVLIGHSFGGRIAAKVMEQMDAPIHQLLLLQPVLHPVPSTYKVPWITKRLLKNLKSSALKKTLLAQHHFVEDPDQMAHYIRYVLDDLQSPRIRKTTAEVMAALSRSADTPLQPALWNANKVRILWGDKDTEHAIPRPFRHLAITRIPFGHQFPIEKPELSGEWIKASRYI